jgi:dihydropteroate synthase
MVVIDKPAVMGIINITPDSFYAGSRVNDPSMILRQADKMIEEGADFVDVGGQSTRPGSERITVDDELRRVVPAIENISRRFPGAVLSIDTFYSKVAAETVAHGASIVNDVSCGSMDGKMFPVVAELDVPYVCMHAQGTPDNMQQNPLYDKVAREVLDFFVERTNECKQAGIKDLILDPGFGFGKTIRHNFELLKSLRTFSVLDLPVLVGISRKSTIYKTLGTTADEALNGTTVLNTIALLNGANILRVHDVKEAREAITLLEEYGQ